MIVENESATDEMSYLEEESVGDSMSGLENESVATLAYYFKNDHKTRVEFSKYTIDTVDGVVQNKKSGEVVSCRKYGKYNRVGVLDDKGKYRMIQVGRAVASTFLGAPPTRKHTADHKDRDPSNDALANIRWLDPPGQRENQERPDTYRTAFVVVKDGVGKTAKEWVAHLAGKLNHKKREYTESMIQHYAQRKTHGYAFKEYPDLEGEEWKDVGGSENTQGHWKISNMSRVKYVTTHAENVLSGDRLGRITGYPTVRVNGELWLCHVIAFRAFYPELWEARQSGEIVLHEDDDKEDFRPHKLRLGTQSKNVKDAYDNGKYDSTKRARMMCASYVDGVHEKDHDSQTAAAEYLKSKGCSEAPVKSIARSIGLALSGGHNTAYKRTWQKIV